MTWMVESFQVFLFLEVVRKAAWALGSALQLRNIHFDFSYGGNIIYLIV